MPITVVYDTTCIATGGRCCQWTVPDSVNSVTFEIWGGGGGGAAGTNVCDCCARTQPGGGGGYAMKQLSVTPGSQYTVCAGNAGVSSTDSNYGANPTFGSNGVAGGTSFVTGTGLTSFCATGGLGGTSNFTIQCYGHCGCNGAKGGQGYNGSINAAGMSGILGMAGSNAETSYSIGGAAGGPGGGAGGINGGTNYSGCGHALYNSRLHGRVPGGGGAGLGCYTSCTCCEYGAGRGAPGFVKITW